MSKKIYFFRNHFICSKDSKNWRAKEDCANSGSFWHPYIFAKHLILILSFIFACFYGSFALASTKIEKNISDLFIEATGNNLYEARIKAHRAGMERAILLIANNMSVDKKHFKPIPYEVLQNIFLPVTINNELSTVSKYSATVSYKYNQAQLYKTMLEYGDETVDELFYEALVIPVFKLKKNLTIWDKDKRWNDFWISSRQNLDKYKLLLPKKTLFVSKKITQENIFDLKFDDFVQIFSNKYFKKVIIISAELFTNRKDASSIMLIRSHILSPFSDKVEIIEEEYPLQNSDDIEFTVNMFVDKTIDEYGKFSETKAAAQPEEIEQIDEPKAITMILEAFSKDELNNVEQKLLGVKEIDYFKIEHDYDTKYKIVMHVSVSEYELAQGLYLNGLSYKIYGNLYQLIDVKQQGA